MSRPFTFFFELLSALFCSLIFLPFDPLLFFFFLFPPRLPVRMLFRPVYTAGLLFLSLGTLVQVRAVVSHFHSRGFLGHFFIPGDVLSYRSTGDRILFLCFCCASEIAFLRFFPPRAYVSPLPFTSSDLIHPVCRLGTASPSQGKPSGVALFFSFF